MSQHIINQLTTQVTDSLGRDIDSWYLHMQDKYVPGFRASREAYAAQEHARRLYMQAQQYEAKNKESYDTRRERNREAHKQRLAKSRGDQTASPRPQSSAKRNSEN